MLLFPFSYFRHISSIDYAAKENVGFSFMISIGNSINITVADVIDYLSTKSWVRSLVLYTESICNPRDFMSAARSFSRQRPIIVYKAGRFEESAELSKLYTGERAATNDLVYDAAFFRAGCLRVYGLADLVDTAELLAKQNTPQGSRLAIITNAGALGLIATDTLLETKGSLASLSEDTKRRLLKNVPRGAAVLSNPVDLGGFGSPEQLSGATGIILQDEGVDAVLFIFSPQVCVDAGSVAQSVISTIQSFKAALYTSKPTFVVCMGGSSVEKARESFNEAGIPTYSNPEPAVRAFMHLVDYARAKVSIF